MYNWSVDTKQAKKSSEQFIIWKLEQMINFGLNREKLNRKQLIKYWSKLHLDQKKKAYLHKLLWPTKPF